MQMMTRRVKSTSKRDVVRACVNFDVRARKKIENNINNNNREKRARERKIQSVEKEKREMPVDKQTNKRGKKRFFVCTGSN